MMRSKLLFLIFISFFMAASQSLYSQCDCEEQKRVGVDSKGEVIYAPDENCLQIKRECAEREALARKQGDSIDSKKPNIDALIVIAAASGIIWLLKDHPSESSAAASKAMRRVSNPNMTFELGPTFGKSGYNGNFTSPLKSRFFSGEMKADIAISPLLFGIVKFYGSFFTNKYMYQLTSDKAIFVDSLHLNNPTKDYHEVTGPMDQLGLRISNKGIGINARFAEDHGDVFFDLGFGFIAKYTTFAQRWKNPNYQKADANLFDDPSVSMPKWKKVMDVEQGGLWSRPYGELGFGIYLADDAFFIRFATRAQKMSFFNNGNLPYFVRDETSGDYSAIDMAISKWRYSLNVNFGMVFF